MKIAEIKTAVVQGNYDWTYIRVYMDNGVVGLGESFFAPGLTAIIDQLATVLIGEDGRDISRLFAKMQRASSGAGSVAGIVYNAISGIEAALWDALGKSLNVPVYRLLGGKHRDKVKMYADCHAGREWPPYYDPVLQGGMVGWAEDLAPTDEEEAEIYSPQAYAERAKEAVAKGFRALKFDLDVPNPYQEEPDGRRISKAEALFMMELAQSAVEAAGPEVEVGFDLHWRYDFASALRVAHLLEPLNVAWLEDPVPPEASAALRDLSRATRTPISTGENLYLTEGFLPLLQDRSVRIVSPDLQKTGGLLEGLRIANMADAYLVGFAPHNISSPIGTMASAHVCAAARNFVSLEFHGQDVPFWDELAIIPGRDRLIVNGYIPLTEAPGIGIELNEEVARRYAKPGELFFGERLDQESSQAAGS